MTRDELQKRIGDVIAKCIRNDYAFGSYAHEVTKVVWPVLEAAEKERDALRAKITEMEKQDPAWFIDERGVPQKYDKNKAEVYKCGGLDLLYTLPGSKGE